MDHTDTALRMDGISKSFGPVKALRNVTFTASKAAVHALCGENGAGKSTLMKVLAGVHQPDSGSIEINDAKMNFAFPADAIAAGVSMIYQELDLAEDLTVAENVFLGAEPAGFLPGTIDRNEIVRQTTRLVSEYGFGINPEALVSELSTGDCQIVEIIKSLRRNCSILVMDEPTSSLSEAEATRLFEVVKSLREKGLCIIYISHRLEEVMDLADDISVLRDGEVVHSGSAEGMDIPTVVRHMVGRDIHDFFPPRQAAIGEPCLVVENLASDTGIKDISFEVKSGEILGVAGLVGAGRTGVAQAVFGVHERLSGRVMLDGKELDIKSPADAIQNGIALLTEDRKRTGLCLNLPCGWNITLPNLDKPEIGTFLSPEKERELASGFAEKIHMKWAGPDAPADSLSGGNQQKLLIARWVMANSRCLIVDEPTRGVDVGAKREIYVLLNSLAEQGKAILFISSELPELFGVADRIMVMRRGKVAGVLDTKTTAPDKVMHLAAVEAD